MSNSLVSRSPDLQRLVDEGFDLEILDANLVVKHVPCLNAQRQVVYATLVSELSTKGQTTIAPGTHEIWVAGAMPCDHAGRELPIINQRTTHDFGRGLVATCSLSGKRRGQMPKDYYDKITHYVDVLSQYARSIEPAATARTYPVHATTPDESPFRYLDAASSRAGLSAVTSKIELAKVAIVGLGGTGAYILDQVAKTPVREIHLFDDDVLFAHNAFRAPGAATLDELVAMPKKVDYLFQKYDPMHSGIIPHPVKVDATNVADLLGMDFVFLSIDASPAKRDIVTALVESGKSFVDSGMGMYRRETSLGGILRVTTSRAGQTEHLSRRVAFFDRGPDEYDWNIQTADLNMLNAAMAVMKWKKVFGYYVDLKGELNTTFTVSRNQMISGDVPE